MNCLRTLLPLLTLAAVLSAGHAAPLVAPPPSGATPAASLFAPPKSGDAPATKPATEAEQFYQRALERLVANDLDGAQRAFARALELQPGYANAMLGLAEVAARRNRLDDAAGLIRDAVKAEPGNAHVHASLGRLQAMRGQFKEAEASLKKAAELDPKLIRPRIDLADLYATTFRKPREALALYRAVLVIEPNHAGAHYASGVVLIGLGELEAAQRALEAAQRIEPGNPLPPLALARLKITRKDAQGAMTWVERALAIRPGMPEALEARADIWQMRGEVDKALADYASVLGASPGRVGVLLKQGSLLQKLGKSEAAAEAYQEAIKHDPRAAIAYNNLAWMAAEGRKNLDQAEKWARTAIELGPNVSAFHDTLGWVQRARGDSKAAEKSLLHATSLGGVTASTFHHLGVVQAELGKKAEAAKAFERALALDKNHAESAVALQRLARP